MKIKWLCLLLIYILPLLLLSSCLNLRCEIQIAENGSGIIDLDYTVSYLSFVYNQENARMYNPLPVTEEMLLAVVQETGGLTVLESPLTEETAPGRNLKISLRFDRVESLDRFVKGLYEQYAVELSTSSDGMNRLNVILPSVVGDIVPETLAILEEMYTDEQSVFVLETPSPIESSSAGVLENDNRKAVYAVNTLDLIKSSFQWEVTW